MITPAIVAGPTLGRLIACIVRFAIVIPHSERLVR
jgi:hypothetical protein